MTESQAYQIGYLTSAISGSIKTLERVAQDIQWGQHDRARARAAEVRERLKLALIEATGQSHIEGASW